MAEERILVVDADPASLRVTCSDFRTEGYRVSGVSTGEEALEFLNRNTPDLVLLDIVLPGIDGFEVCRHIREVSSIPIVILTARNTADDKVKGLCLGADDYVTKPFVARELLARVKALLRRARWSVTPSTQPSINIQGLHINRRTRRVSVGGREIHLSPTEYRLLYSLAAHPGTLLTRDQLLEAVWEPIYRGHYDILRVALWRLRRKLEDNPDRPRYIVTLPGQGYMLALEE